jgi:hypothetical protein
MTSHWPTNAIDSATAYKRLSQRIGPELSRCPRDCAVHSSMLSSILRAWRFCPTLKKGCGECFSLHTQSLYNACNDVLRIAVEGAERHCYSCFTCRQRIMYSSM